MAAGKVRRGGHGDKELAAVGARPGVSHRQDAGSVKGQGGDDFILKPIARPAAAGAGGVAALNHKVGNDPVENHPVIKALAGQKDKVVHRQRRILGEQFHADDALIGADVGAVAALGVDGHFRRLGVFPDNPAALGFGGFRRGGADNRRRGGVGDAGRRNHLGNIGRRRRRSLGQHTGRGQGRQQQQQGKGNNRFHRFSRTPCQVSVK